MIATGIRRGLAAGLLAGLLTGALALVVGHGPMTQAARVEESGHAGRADDPAATDTDHAHDDGAHDDGAHAHDDGAHVHDETDHAHGGEHAHLLSRGTQQALLPATVAVIGAALGGLLGVAVGLARARRPSVDAWRLSLRLGVVGWAVTVLAPALTFPPGPPGAGASTDVSGRTQGYLLTIGVACLLAAALWAGGHRLASTRLRAPARQIVLATVGVLAAAGLLVAMPSATVGDGFPAELLWRFRLVSLGTQTLLWASVAAGIGLLYDRAAARGEPAAVGAGR